jgi:hypothetical protein
VQKASRPLSRPPKASDLPIAGWQKIAQSALAAATVLANHSPPQPHEALYLAGFALEVALKGKGLQEGVAVDPIHDLEELLVRSQILRPAKGMIVAGNVAAKQGLPISATYWDLFDIIRSQWFNELRYSVGSVRPTVAADFVDIVRELEGWLWNA